MALPLETFWGRTLTRKPEWLLGGKCHHASITLVSPGLGLIFFLPPFLTSSSSPLRAFILIYKHSPVPSCPYPFPSCEALRTVGLGLTALLFALAADKAIMQPTFPEP